VSRHTVEVITETGGYISGHHHTAADAATDVADGRRRYGHDTIRIGPVLEARRDLTDAPQCCINAARCPWCLEPAAGIHLCEYEAEAVAALHDVHTAPEIRTPFRL
jgi:hypothetical protein